MNARKNWIHVDILLGKLGQYGIHVLRDLCQDIVNLLWKFCESILKLKQSIVQNKWEFGPYVLNMMWQQPGQSTFLL